MEGDLANLGSLGGDLFKEAAGKMQACGGRGDGAGFIRVNGLVSGPVVPGGALFSDNVRRQRDLAGIAKNLGEILV